MWRVLLVTVLFGGSAFAQPAEAPPPIDRPAAPTQAERDYDRCKVARGAAIRNAEALLDPDERGNALRELPNCEEPPSRAFLGMRKSWGLTTDESDLLRHGEISDNRQAAAVAINVVFGAGLGQALEGRWLKTGWIFWAGDLISTSLLMVGVTRDLSALGDLCFDFGEPSSCPPPRDHPSGRNYLIAGFTGLIVFRLASVIDAVYGARAHNERVRRLRGRASILPSIAPINGGATAGVALRF